MAALKEILPPAKSSSTTFYDHSSDPWFKQRYSAPKEEEGAVVGKIPLYNTAERLKYRPSKAEHYGDGRAFPEIHYPVEREQEPRRVKDRDQPRESREERIQREKIREERRRERERERRLEAMGKKSKLTRDRDRDISEKVALGMAYG